MLLCLAFLSALKLFVLNQDMDQFLFICLFFCFKTFFGLEALDPYLNESHVFSLHTLYLFT